MLKSATMFGLFLTSSLVMLVPFANTNLFSNAMAVENSYDSYNNYYNNNDSKYSKYPTKVNKYVCQTGQFQGFYVESVEFCKLKIAQGPAGPQGLTGPQGIQGIQGPIGANGTQRFHQELLISIAQI